MSVTKSQAAAIKRQPFSVEELQEFLGRGNASRAKLLAITLGEALEEADRAQARGNSEDLAFELAFLDGASCIDDDELYDCFWSQDESPEEGPAAELTAYDESLDATFYIGHNHAETAYRPFFIVRYEWKENCYAYSGWWLDRFIGSTKRKAS